MTARHQQSVEELALVLWNYHRVLGALTPADVLVGLGSYDLRVAKQCARLFHESMAPWLVFTGRHGNWTRGRWSRTEAEVFAEAALAAGVPGDRILLEAEATNIGENLRFTKALLAGRGLRADRLIVVTKPQTLRRVVATAPVSWPEAIVQTSCPEVDFLDQPTSDHSLGDLINEMVGDVSRILEYPRLGYQVPQEVPAEVLSACAELQARGYTAHLPAPTKPNPASPA